jgi:hypothetical protein
MRVSAQISAPIVLRSSIHGFEQYRDRLSKNTCDGRIQAN